MTIPKLFRNMPANIFMLTAFLMLTGVVGTEITQMNVRFALLVEEINRSGPGMFPLLNGVPYLDYFSSWLLAAWLTSFGGRVVTLTGLALPAILLGAYTAMMVYLIGERVRKGVGLGAVMLLLITPEFSALFTGLGIDVPVMAVGVTALYMLQRDDISLPRFCGIFFLILLASFLIRGPLGVILPCAGVCGFLLATRKWKGFFAAGFTGAAAGIIGIACCIGLILLTGGRELLDMFVMSQFHERVSHGKRSLTLFLDIYSSIAPVAIISLAIFLHSRRRIFSKPAAGWIGFLALPLILMILPTRVHTRYLAILMPCWALLGSYALSCGRLGRRFRNLILRFRHPLDCWYRPLVCLAVLIVAVVGIFMSGASKQPWGHYLVTVLLVISIPYWTGKDLTPFRPLLALGIFIFAAFDPFIAADENSRYFTRAVESVRTGQLWLLELGPDHDDLKYLLHTAPEKRFKARYIFFELPQLFGVYKKMYKINSIYDVIEEIKESDVIVLFDRRSVSDELQALAAKNHRRLEVIASGTLGHRNCIAVRMLRQPDPGPKQEKTRSGTKK